MLDYCWYPSVALLRRTTKHHLFYRGSVFPLAAARTVFYKGMGKSGAFRENL
jgi:hypothetical protein